MTKTTHTWKKPFFTIATGQTVSLIGSSAVQFAVIWWLASETGSALMLAFSGLMAFLPQAILGPFAGVWIDRLKRKYVVITADLFIGVAALVFAIFFWIGPVPYWSACIVLGVRAVGGVFHTPAIQAMIPMLVPKEQLVRANGWSQFMQSGAFILGPVLGAAMYGVLPMPVILLTDFFGALVASFTVCIVHIPDSTRAHQKTAGFWKELKEGANVFRHDKKLCGLLAATAVCMIFYMPLSSLYPLMTSTHFEASALHASIVEFLYAAGMMVSSLLLGTCGKITRKLLAAHIGALGVGLTSLLCGILPAQMWAFWVFAFLCLFMGGGGNLYNIACISYMQETIPSQAQGRAFSLMGSVMSLAMPVGLLISGPVAEGWGIASWFLLTGIVTLTITACSFLYLKKQQKQA